MKPQLKLFLVVDFLLFVFLFFFFQQNHSGLVMINEIVFFILSLFITTNITGFLNSGSEITVSISLPILIPAMVLLDPFWAGIVVLVGTINIIDIKDFVWYKFAFNRTVLFLAASLGSFVLHNFLTSNEYTHLILPIFLGALVYFLINNGLVYLVVRIASGKQGTSILVYYLQLIKNFIFSYFLGLVFYLCYINLGKLFMVLAIVFVYVLKDFMFSRIQQLNSFTQVVEGFLKVIDSKDHYTEGHCENVAVFTGILCKELGLSKSKTERIVSMAKIHDIGKIYVDDTILKSSSVITDAEYKEMKEHSFYGYEVLKDIDILKRDLDVVLYHHEKYNGKGYPEGLKGEEIPYGARVLSVCDAFDVMCRGRDYKPAMNKYEIINELRACASTHFDPEIARALIKLIDHGEFDDIIISEDISDEYNNINVRSALKLHISGMEG